MSKSEIARQLSVVSAEKRIAASGSSINQIVQKTDEAIERIESSSARVINSMASGLEPLAQAMTALVGETSDSLLKVKEAAEKSTTDLEGALQRTGKAWSETTGEAKAALRDINTTASEMKTSLDASLTEAAKQRQRTSWVWGLVTGFVLAPMLMAALATASWIWLGPAGQLSLVESVHIRLSALK